MVVTPIGSDVDVGCREPRCIKQRVAGASTDCHRLDGRLQVTGDSEPGPGGRKGSGHSVDEIAERLRVLQATDPPEPGRTFRRDRALRPGQRRGQRNGRTETESNGQGVVHTSDGDVSIGVRTEEADTAVYEVMNHSTFPTSGGHLMHGSQEQRVMSDDQVCPPGDGLGYDGRVRVHRKEHAAHRRTGTTTDEPDSVPLLGCVLGVTTIQQVNNIRQR